MLAHDTDCDCVFCRRVKRDAVKTEQVDRDIFAAEWEHWVSRDDGEARKMRAGADGNPGSPRWVAPQAIARARTAASGRKA